MRKTTSCSIKVVAPLPLTSTKSFSSGSTLRSSNKASSIKVTVASAVCKGLALPFSPCKPTPTSIQPAATWAISIPVAGLVAPLAATAKLAILSAKLWAMAVTSSKDLPARAAAPTILYKGTQPTIPLRLYASSRLALAISSCTTIFVTLRPSFSACFTARLEAKISPA